MKAIMYEEFGPPDVLQVREIQKPSPKSNEILIRIYASPVNYGDLTARNFRNIPLGKFNMPIPFMLPARIYLGVSKPRKKIRRISSIR